MVDFARPRDPNGVTVVIPTLNRGGFLINCLRDLLAQRHAPLELFVVDQSTEADETLQNFVDAHDASIRHDRVSFRGLPEARNYGWRHARFNAIVFVDDDIRCGPNLVSEHFAALGREGVGLVAGGIDVPDGCADRRPMPGVYRRWTATPLRGFSALGSFEADHAAGCNFSAWRAALEAAGGFDERLSPGAALYEETDLCLRVKLAGYRVRFHGMARLTHLVAPAGGCRVDRVRDYVRTLAHNRAVMIRRHCRWYHAPVALGRLAGLGLSYARFYQQPWAVVDCVTGCCWGLRDGGRRPLCRAGNGGAP